MSIWNPVSEYQPRSIRSHKISSAVGSNLQITTTHNNAQHTTTLHNSTRVHKTTNVPVVFMALILILNGFEGCNIITRGFFGPKWHSLCSCHFRAQKSLDFQGPPFLMPLVMMLHPSKPLHTAP